MSFAFIPGQDLILGPGYSWVVSFEFFMTVIRHIDRDLDSTVLLTAGDAQPCSSLTFLW